MTIVNYSLGKALTRYFELSKDFESFFIFAFVCLIFVVLIIVNIDNKKADSIFYGLNIVLIGIIIFTYGLKILDNLDSFFNFNLYKNIYFYITNMILSILVISWVYSCKRIEKVFKRIVIIFYYLTIVNLLFMIYISNYLQNVMIYVVGNTYPMVYFGNIISFILYGIILLYWIIFMKKKKIHRMENHF